MLKKMMANYVGFILTGNGNPSNFDLARPAFEELFGQDGIAAGNGSAEWEVESDWTKCEGNLGPF